MQLFRQAIESSPLVDKSDVQFWIDEIEEGDEDAIHALIVMRLAHLKSFTLLSLGRAQFRLSDTIKRISKSQDTEALSRLEDVTLGHECAAWVHIFSALPSVKAIRDAAGRLLQRRGAKFELG